MSTNNCPSCGAPVGLNVTECKYCGESIVVSQPQNQVRHNGPIQNSFMQTTHHSSTTTTNSMMNANVKEFANTMTNNAMNNAQNMNNMNMQNMQHMQNMNNMQYVPGKSKTTAGLLAIFLGGLGVHKFYLGRTGWGVVYLLFLLDLFACSSRTYRRYYLSFVK